MSRLKKVLVTSWHLENSISLLKQEAEEVLFRKDERTIRHDSSMDEVEVLIGNNPFPNLDLVRMEKLKWIQLVSMGTERVPWDIVGQKGVVVTNASGVYSIPIAEWIITKILEVYKKSRVFFEQQSDRRWEKQREITELSQKRIGFIGTGSIAKTTAHMLRGFSPYLLGLNTNGRMVSPFHECFSEKQLCDFLEKCDVVVVTAPLTEKTKQMLNRNTLDTLQENAVLINVSRGGLIEEEALLRRLSEGTLRGACLDVFEHEPLANTSPCWNIERLTVTPHNAYVSEFNAERLFKLVQDNIERYKNGLPLNHIVEK